MLIIIFHSFGFIYCSFLILEFKILNKDTREKIFTCVS